MNAALDQSVPEPRRIGSLTGGQFVRPGQAKPVGVAVLADGSLQVDAARLRGKRAVLGTLVASSWITMASLSAVCAERLDRLGRDRAPSVGFFTRASTLPWTIFFATES